jgi:predicted patatin/cPLA2 family phospholipase
MLAPTYHAPITLADLREPRELDHPVLRIAVERALAGSQPRRREDEHVLALAIEGGGMGGAVSAGMCVMLDALGLIPSFDLIYGCSAGALNGLWTAAGQAPLGATNYEDAASREFISTLRLLRGKPVVDLAFLFDQLARHVKPYSADGLAAGPAFRVIATSVERGDAVVLRDFDSMKETLAAVRASCALPLLGGELPRFRGELMSDGGLVEAVPYRSALRDGATHVLVLRSRAANHRKDPAHPATLAAVARQHPALRELLRARSGRYNVAAEALAHADDDPELRSRVVQFAPSEADVVGRLERDRARVVAGQQAGAREIAAALCREPAALLWQPQAYRVTAAPPPAPDVPLRATIAAARPRLRDGASAVRHAPTRLREGPVGTVVPRLRKSAADAMREAPARLRESAAEAMRHAPERVRGWRATGPRSDH